MSKIELKQKFLQLTLRQDGTFGMMVDLMQGVALEILLMPIVGAIVSD